MESGKKEKAVKTEHTYIHTCTEKKKTRPKRKRQEIVVLCESE